MPAVIDAVKCDGCGACLPVCSQKGGAIYMDNGTARVNEDLCMECGACTRACPRGAISIVW